MEHTFLYRDRRPSC